MKYLLRMLFGAMLLGGSGWINLMPIWMAPTA